MLKSIEVDDEVLERAKEYKKRKIEKAKKAGLSESMLNKALSERSILSEFIRLGSVEALKNE